MNRAFTILRAAREERHMTLADIADATLVNIDHLRAIDEGRVGILPEAYVRAFMREYASLVGLDPQEVMQVFDEERGQQSAADGVGVASAPEVAPSPPERHPAAWTRRFLDSGQYTRTVVTLVTLGIAVIVSWNLFGTGTLRMKEISFRDVVKDNEAHSGITNAAGPSGRAMKDTLTDKVAAGDSLTLTARTTDSVWVRMMIDDEAPREYLFGPRAKITWHGYSRFLFFTIGNAGALELALNGKPLGPAGKPGRVIQKLVVTKTGITERGTEPPTARDTDAGNEINAMPVAPIERDVP